MCVCPLLSSYIYFDCYNLSLINSALYRILKSFSRIINTNPWCWWILFLFLFFGQSVCQRFLFGAKLCALSSAILFCDLDSWVLLLFSRRGGVKRRNCPYIYSFDHFFFFCRIWLLIYFLYLGLLCHFIKQILLSKFIFYFICKFISSVAFSQNIDEQIMNNGVVEYL